MKRIMFFLLILGTMSSAFGQIKLKGKVTDAKNEPLPGVNITLEGNSHKGTVSDMDGNFALNVEKLPVTLVFSYIGYKTVKKKISSDAPVKVVLAPSSQNLDEVVVVATKSKERLRESPVTIERLSLKKIQYAAAPDFYDDLSNLRGVQMNTNSLTFQAPNTRGFATFANNRMLQIIDGVENSSPSLNFPLGNFVGISDLDVKSVELLPGTSSALYGANAFNGLIYMTSKSPFKYQGLNTELKYGYTRQQAAGVRPMYKAAVRYAKAFNNKFAFKVNFSYLKATDWFAVDYRDFDRSIINKEKRGSRLTNPSYDGLNIYGDEVATDIDLTAYGLGIIHVSRTGYKEKDLTDYGAKSIKGDFSLHFRPIKDSKAELIWSSRFGGGQTIYQGSNRFVLKDLLLHQHKLELRNDNYFVRAYYTSEDAGHSYDTRFAAWNINRKWKDDITWFTQYAQAYVISRMNGASDAMAHALARSYADTGRYEPGTPEFQKAFDEVVNDPDFKTGARFIDKTSLFHLEGNYSFKNLVKNGEIQVGASARRFSLNSQGTIFTDYDGLIFINEQAVFAQYLQNLFHKHVKINASLRVDKQDQFKPNISPRVALVWMPDQDRKQVFRVAYQTGFRYPTTQDLYIGLNLGYASLVGGHPKNWDRYTEDAIDNQGNNFQFTGRDAYENSYTLSSFMKFAQTHNPADLEIANVKPVGPEQISTFELGYRGTLSNNWTVDATFYNNHYNHFIIQPLVMTIASSYGNVHDMSAMNAIMQSAYKPMALFSNADVPINSYGFDLNIGKSWNGYTLNFIYDYAKLDFNKKKYPDFKTYFNTPENTIKIVAGNPKVFGNFGFSVAYKYMDSFYWESSFADDFVPQHSTIDAMINYNIPKYNLIFKLGGTNILGPDYMVAPGTGKVGSIYYFSVNFKK